MQQRGGGALALRPRHADHPRPACSASHSDVAVVTGTPAASTAAAPAGSRHAGRAHRHPHAQRRTAPRGASRERRRSAPPATGASRGRRRAAARRRPRRRSWPREPARELIGERADLAAGAPHADARPSSCENRTNLRQQRRGHGVLVAEREHGVGIARVGGRTGQHLVHEPPHDACRRSSARPRASRRIAAMLSSSSPTHSNGLGRRSRSAARTPRTVDRRPAGRAEHLAQVPGRRTARAPGTRNGTWGSRSTTTRAQRGVERKIALQLVKAPW